MKKLFLAAMAAFIAIAPAFAQTKQDVKAAKKEAKTVAKQLKKQGYELLEVGDLQTQLQQFLVMVKSGKKQVVGTAENCMSVNLAKTTALNNAINEYATMSGGMVKGRLASNASNIDGQQADNIVAAYERLVLKEIKGEIQTCITLVKKNKKNFDVKVYCLIDFDAAHAAKMKAMNLALEELELSNKYGSAVANWVDEGFKTE